MTTAAPPPVTPDAVLAVLETAEAGQGVRLVRDTFWLANHSEAIAAIRAAVTSHDLADDPAASKWRRYFGAAGKIVSEPIPRHDDLDQVSWRIEHDAALRERHYG